MPKFAASQPPLAISTATIPLSDSAVAGSPLAGSDRRSAPIQRGALLPAERDPLSPARGFILGIAVAAGFWVVGGMTAYLLL